MSGRIFSDPPVVCGHRGLGKGTVDGHLENTLGSFLAAAAAGVDWVEVDVRTTSDGALFTAHYPTMDDGRFFAEVTGDECDALGLLRITDLLDALPDHVGVDLDVKSSLEDTLRDRSATTAAVVASLAARELDRRPLLVTSFDPAALLIVREHAPRVPVGLLTWVRFPLRKAIPAARHLGADAVVAHVGSFTVNDTDTAPVHHPLERAVGVAHEAGLEVGVWCPTPDELDPLLDAAVDCVIVNDVAATVERVRNRRRSGAISS